MGTLKKIDPSDNVFVVFNPVKEGEIITTSGIQMVIKQSLNRGHKVAAGMIRNGEKIVKFGLPIGSATRDIHPGEYIHLHNMKSDFLPTYTLENAFTTKK